MKLKKDVKLSCKVTLLRVLFEIFSYFHELFLFKQLKKNPQLQLKVLESLTFMKCQEQAETKVRILSSKSKRSTLINSTCSWTKEGKDRTSSSLLPSSLNSNVFLFLFQMSFMSIFTWRLLFFFVRVHQ